MENKNNGVTPSDINDALENLPHNYVKQTLIVLEKWKDSGVIEKSFSKRYIIKVKKADEAAFNEDIMNALVEVGNKNKEVKERFGLTKKTSKEN
jgi:hypothetical protein